MKAYSILVHLENGHILIDAITALVVLIVLSILALVVYLEGRWKKNIQNLQYREELFNSLCSTINDIFVIYHFGKNLIEYISPNVERILGKTGKEFLSHPEILLDYLDEETSDKVKKSFTSDVKDSNFEIECEISLPDSIHPIWLIIRFYPIIKNRNVIRYICTISDLTREKQTQQILCEALANSQKANEAKKEFLSHMSHELKTPINAISGMAQIAMNSIDDKHKVSSCLGKITSSSKNLLLLINNILDMAKIDSDKLQIIKENFCLRFFLESLVSIFRSQAELNHQDFELRLTDIKDVSLIGDTLRLSQVLGNCISNSLKFTPPGGKIVLEVTELEKHNNRALFRFTLTDNGMGMSKEYLERIFIPFEQENSTIYKKYGGSGLGMSIAKSLVTMMGGNIRVSSKPGEGTKITIDIVFDIRSKVFTPSEKVTTEESITVQPDRLDLSGHRILVVEDNAINLEIACELLKYVNISVATATSGKDAIQYFLNSNSGYFDAILMDLQMPGVNGYEASKKIRQSNHPDAKNIKIIAMSADTYSEDNSLTMESGINYHVTKPIEIDSFYSLLQKIITIQKDAEVNTVDHDPVLQIFSSYQ